MSEAIMSIKYPQVAVYMCENSKATYGMLCVKWGLYILGSSPWPGFATVAF